MVNALTKMHILHKITKLSTEIDDRLGEHHELENEDYIVKFEETKELMVTKLQKWID